MLDVQYRIGSITKTLTAVLVLQLVRDGRLSLDDPASAVLGDVGYADRTIRSLLAHNAGIRSEPVGSWWERSVGLTWDELVGAHEDADAVFPALQQFHYSNLGFALLGEVAARLYGATWWECVRTRILDPLGMTRTSYLPTGAAAQGHSVHPYARTLVDEPATDTGAMAPAGQAWATLGDLATYNAFLLAGHDDVLSLDWLLTASHPQAGDRRDALTSGHGLGFQLQAGGSGMLVGHTGSMPGFLAACFVDRERRTGAVVLANATTGLQPNELAGDLLDELERREPHVPPAWRPTETVPRRARRRARRLALGQHAVRVRHGGRGAGRAQHPGRREVPLRRRGRAGDRDVGLPRRRDPARRPAARRLGQPPGHRDVHLHAHAVRPGRAGPRWAPGLTLSGRWRARTGARRTGAGRRCVDEDVGMAHREIERTYAPAEGSGLPGPHPAPGCRRDR